MSKIIAVLKNKWFIQGIGLLMVFLLIWLVGPAIAVAENYFLASVASRLLLMMVIVALWLGNIFRVKYLSKKNNDEMVEELGQSEIDEETGAISEHFDNALKTLNESAKGKKGGTQLYELPWYIIIGPPGSGKTTALVNSGLQFPLESEFGKESLRGVGGTRHCDWWFTTEAVLIDTAGRFTTQDSHEAVDKAAWQQFMDLLKKYRKQRPINGALVAVSITDIIALSDHERANYAHTIRTRIDELTKQLGIRFPVYFMFTKCDLVLGFNEFFAHLNSDERAQVWGETFNLDHSNGKNTAPNSEITIENYPQHFDQLIHRLKGQMLSRVNEELDLSLRPAVLGFPAQMESLREPLALFLRDVFSGNRFQQSALLRGVYFTSGTQEGTPLDRLLGNMAANWGAQAPAAMGNQTKGKSYFLRRLLQDVIFPEAELAGIDQQVVNKRRLWQRVGFFTAAASLIGAISFWGFSYKQNLEYINSTRDHVTVSQQAAHTADVMGTDFTLILPELNAMREASEVFDSSTMLAHGGLYQGDSLGSQTDKAYLAVLEKKLLPMVAARLQELIIILGEQGDTSLTYELLKAYLMYAGYHNDAGVEIDRALLASISKVDWQQTFSVEPSVAEQLVQHHHYLLENSHAQIKLAKNDRIVSFARRILKRLPLSEQVYQSIKQQLSQDHSKDLLFSDMAGNQGLDVFTSRSGQSLADKVMPGMFTKAGFYKGFMLEYPTQADDYLNNNWVLGQHNANKIPIAPEALKLQVYQRYYKDYSKQWKALLKDLKLKQSAELSQGIDIIDRATLLNGPIETLIITVAQQTDLSQPLPTGKAAEGVADTLGVVSGSAQRAVSKVNRLVRASNKAGVLKEFGKPVTDSFLAFHRLIQTKRGEPPLTSLMTETDRFVQYLKQTLVDGFSETSALDAVKKRSEGSGNDRFGALLRQTGALPPAVKSWIASMRQTGWSLMLAKSRIELNQLWASEVAGFYDQAIKGRYPLNTQSDIELELRDFAEFFRPKGVVDQFVKQHMTPFLKLKSTPWEQKTIDGQTLKLSNRTIRQLYNAQQITRLFFGRNASEPKISFVMKPDNLDASVKQFRFNLGDQQIAYAHGPQRPVKMSWPLNPGLEEAKIHFTPRQGKPVMASTKGPWSLFKMLDQAQVDATGQQSLYHVTFSQSGFDAKFELRVDSDFNPLGARLLQNFNLPMEL